MNEDNRLTWEEAVQLAMKRTGKNRRQATAMLIEYCRQGKLPAFAYILDTGEEVGQIPPSVFPKIN